VRSAGQQDDAIASGHGAYKLEEKEDEPNVFSVEVGNLPPGQEATISITYTTELSFVEGLVRAPALLTTIKRSDHHPRRVVRVRSCVQLQFRLPMTNDNPSYFAANKKDFNVPQLKLTAKLGTTSTYHTHAVGLRRQGDRCSSSTEPRSAVTQR
jgi:hypothetical protein